MIHYSIVPFEDIYSNSESNASITRLIQYQGCQVEVTLNNGVTKVNRVISTSLDDYLKAELQPGTIINHDS